MASVSDDAASTESTFKRIIGECKFLGKGSFGEVYGPFTWKGIECAIKRRVFNKSELGEQMKKEIEACRKWMSLKHKNLILVVDTACDANFNPPAMYICMEFARGGSVEDALKDANSSLPIDVVKDWAKQVACGMAYLHQNSIVHRDLKSENIVISEDISQGKFEGKTLKITDFDCVRDHHHTVVMSFKGTYAWMAPEVRKNASFSKASDVWSYGVLLWAMITRKDQKEMQFDTPETAPDVFKYLMTSTYCMAKDTTKRPEFAIVNSWFEKPEIVVNLVAANNKSKIERIPVDFSVDQLLTLASNVFGYQNNVTEIRLGFEDKSLDHGSGQTIWQAGIQHLSTLVLIVRQEGGN